MFNFLNIFSLLNNSDQFFWSIIFPFLLFLIFLFGIFFLFSILGYISLQFSDKDNITPGVRNNIINRLTEHGMILSVILIIFTPVYSLVGIQEVPLKFYKSAQNFTNKLPFEVFGNISNEDKMIISSKLATSLKHKLDSDNKITLFEYSDHIALVETLSTDIRKKEILQNKEKKRIEEIRIKESLKSYNSDS